ncbi:hypothetical protein G5S52_11995 [Grimontia sp. S25]|uniref:Uncharacterized protein n=1 Tax=Grimontia sedimenti TaxID=2711294 RepID=A0A6M1RJD5_9GAMM|nr:hypothetical protein [Grimontia sedimenti]NGN98341.1 hypothetical protein [Grimontia sedimenti]
MAVTAKHLLKIYQDRASMQALGVTHPPTHIVEGTARLVEVLSKLPPEEKILIECAGKTLFIRETNGEVLAEIDPRISRDR